MELQITGTNMEITPEVRRYVERKLGKLDRHLPNIIDTRVEISEEKTKSPQERYLVRITVAGGVGGAAFHGEDRGEDLFKAIDRVKEIIIRQLERHKGKLYDKGRGSSPIRGDFNDIVKPEVSARKLVKTKRFTLEAMTLNEAIEQMEKLGHSFFLFLDVDSDEIRLLYRRNDGDYGLIEPELG